MRITLLPSYLLHFVAWYRFYWVFPGDSVIKNLLANAADVGLIPGLGRFLKKEMATHSSIAWKIPWTEKAGGLLAK